MPLGIERINVRRRSPNTFINFIAPLEGPDKAIAQDYLERIAAIVYPVMKENQLAVMSLDEFPPNLEFWGRNFNAGECIQLVLKHPKSGKWLPFSFVQGVMIHELAHIKQMNHSSAFWSVRGKYARALQDLHTRSYTGEGFWSAGRTLLSEQFTQDRPLVESELPKHICGGTYRSRTRRRARSSGVKPNYAEQKKRRIERKFGIAGEGKRIGTGDEENEGKPKPRVAQSKRGRELRAKAALERFEKKEEKEEIGIENKDDETVSDSDDEEAINVGGGKFMVAVSGDQDVDGQDIKQELQELLSGACGTVESDIRPDLHPTPVSQPSSLKVPKFDKPSKMHLAALADAETNSAEPCVRTLAPKAKEPFQDQNPAAPDQPRHPISASKQRGTFTTPPPLLVKPGTPPESSSTCPVCSCTNAAYAPTCSACMNVLINPPAADAWKCANESCHSEYRNSQDVVYCGICGAKRLI